MWAHLWQFGNGRCGIHAVEVRLPSKRIASPRSSATLNVNNKKGDDGRMGGLMVLQGTDTGALRGGAELRGRLQAAAAALAIGIGLAVGGAQAAEEADCPPFGFDEPVDSRGLCLKIWGGQEWIDLPTRGFLAFENLLTRELTLNALRVGERVDGHSGGGLLSYRFPLDAFGRSGTSGIVSLGVDGTFLEHDTFLGRFQPPANHGLGIPGAEGGPSGAFIPFATPLENIHWGTDLNWAAPYLNLGLFHEGRFGEHQPYVGVKHSVLSQTEHFTATIPDFQSAFRYDTRIESRANGAHIGLKSRFPIGSPIGPFQTYIGGRGEVGVARTEASLRDHLNFTGFIGGLIDDSVHRARATRTAEYWEIGGGLALENPITRVQVFVDVGFGSRPWFPVAERDGTNPTRVRIDDADTFTVTLGGRIPFGSPPAAISDMRLKRDIAALARLDSGLRLYRFRYLWSDAVHVGVMAQEVEAVRPDAVIRGPDGFLRVDYARLGLRPLTWAQWVAAPASR